MKRDDDLCKRHKCDWRIPSISDSDLYACLLACDTMQVDKCWLQAGEVGCHGCPNREIVPKECPWLLEFTIR